MRSFLRFNDPGVCRPCPSHLALDAAPHPQQEAGRAPSALRAAGRRVGEGLGRRLAWSPCALGVCWQLSLDKELIDFGSYVVGETASRVITLTNTGGLGTRFKFLPASEPCETDITPSVMRLVSVPTAAPQGGGR